MPQIQYKPIASSGAGGKTGGYFFIEAVQGSPEMDIINAVYRATPKADITGKKDSIVSIAPNIQGVLLLQATGFEWEPSALLRALNILADHARSLPAPP